MEIKENVCDDISLLLGLVWKNLSLYSWWLDNLMPNNQCFIPLRKDPLQGELPASSFVWLRQIQHLMIIENAKKFEYTLSEERVWS